MRRILSNHLIMSGFYKGVSGLSLFVSIPILLSYLGNSNYGLWVLIFTVFQWVLVMDFGIQSTLKTKIPILFSEKKTELIAGYIKQTYQYSSYIALFIFIGFAALVYFVDLRQGLNINFHTYAFVNKLILINVFFFCINSVAGIHKSLYVSFLKGKYAEQSLAVNQFGFLILIGITALFFKDIEVEMKLISISLINGVFCLLVNLFYTFRFFKIEKINFYDLKKYSGLAISGTLKIGIKFMVIQLGMMLFFTVDNYIISNNFEPKSIVAYDTINKIFQLPVMIIYASLSPLWSMFAKDYIEKNHANLKLNFKKFNCYFVAILLFVFLLAVFCETIIGYWIKSPLIIPTNLIMLIAIITCFRIFTTFYTFFLNGIGKINKFMFLVIVSLICKLPLTFLFIKLGYGINSVAIATVIILTFWMIIIPIESYQTIKKLERVL